MSVSMHVIAVLDGKEFTNPAFIGGCLLSACALRDKGDVKTYNRSKSELSKRGVILAVNTLALEDGELDGLSTEELGVSITSSGQFTRIFEEISREH